MAVYVVTGGGGFIGSHIVEELVRRKQTVKVIDNFSTGKRENVKPFGGAVEVIEADLSSAPDLTAIFQGTDYVFHQGLRSGNRVAPLFQRVRPAAGSDVAIQRCARALHSRCARGPPAQNLRGWSSVARLHLRAECGGGQPAFMHSARHR